MRLAIVAVGQRVPDWARTAWDDYAKRFPPEIKVELRAVKTEPRGSKTLLNLQAAERERIEAQLPRGVHRVALDEHGTRLSTQALARRLKDWQLAGDDVALIIGGPDGLDAYRAIARGAAAHLMPDGIVALEIGYDQTETVSAIFAAQGFVFSEMARDYGGNDRVLVFMGNRSG